MDIFFEVNSVAAVLCQSLSSKLFRIFVLFRQSLRTLLGGPFNDTYSVSLNLEESSDNYNRVALLMLQVFEPQERLIVQRNL